MQFSFIKKAFMLKRELRDLDSSLAIWDPLNTKKKKHDIQKGKHGAILVVHSSRGFISYHSWLKFSYHNWLKFGLYMNKFLMIMMV